MATHKSAIKRHRQSLERRKRNKIIKSKMKTSVKTLLKVIETKEKEKITKALRQTTIIIAQTATKGVIHKNTAGRKISRLTKRANTVLQANG